MSVMILVSDEISPYWIDDWKSTMQKMKWQNMDPELMDEVKLTTKILRWQDQTLNELSEKRGDKKYMVQVALQYFFDQVDKQSRALSLLEEKIPGVIDAAVRSAVEESQGVNKINELVAQVTNAIDFIRSEADDLRSGAEFRLLERKYDIIYLIALGEDLPGDALTRELVAELIEAGRVEKTASGEFVVSRNALGSD